MAVVIHYDGDVARHVYDDGGRARVGGGCVAAKKVYGRYLAATNNII